jgi:hypothetical protein
MGDLFLGFIRLKQLLIGIRLLVLMGGMLIFVECLQAAEPEPLNGRLQQTRAVNIDAIIDSQFVNVRVTRGFRVADPYSPESKKTLQVWNREPLRDEAVCALRFVDDSKVEYELRDFDTSLAATESNFMVTHQGRCGSCSTLQDLAIYLVSPDLTSPARKCARISGLKRKKQCFQEKIGFTDYCAESWAYNARHTRQECLGVCIADYGFFNLVFGRYRGPNVDETGQLRPCLQCDETESGAGFKYSAGRTRRNSGIESAIQRLDADIFHVDHSVYFPVIE